MKDKTPNITYENQETKLIRKELAFVTILGILLFALMVGLYFWNRASGALDQLFSRVVSF